MYCTVVREARRPAEGVRGTTCSRSSATPDRPADRSLPPVQSQLDDTTHHHRNLPSLCDFQPYHAAQPHTRQRVRARWPRGRSRGGGSPRAAGSHASLTPSVDGHRRRASEQSRSRRRPPTPPQSSHVPPLPVVLFPCLTSAQPLTNNARRHPHLLREKRGWDGMPWPRCPERAAPSLVQPFSPTPLSPGLHMSAPSPRNAHDPLPYHSQSKL